MDNRRSLLSRSNNKTPGRSQRRSTNNNDPTLNERSETLFLFNSDNNTVDKFESAMNATIKCIINPESFNETQTHFN